MSAHDRQEGGDHYKRLGQYEPWYIIDAWKLDFYLGNALKYLARGGHKQGEPAILELKKAVHYLEKKIELLEKSGKGYRKGREFRSVE